MQMWNQRASVMVYPLVCVCESTVSPPRPPLACTALLAFHVPHPTSSPFPSTVSTSLPCSVPSPPPAAGAAASLLGPASPQLSKQAQPLFPPATAIPGLRWFDRDPPLQVATHEICQNFARLLVSLRV
ncbi:hypothetical protein NQZ68_025204 [Dissostichus eleginoides]|nr:hypothetical protein NQZ68_025204 [Dissostichus eleginoides]